MKIIKLNINDVHPYEKNAKLHTEKQINQIVESIKEFGMNDPIGIWGDENIIIEGHGRLEALKKLGYSEVECIRLDHLNDEQRRAYTLAHNKLTMNTDFDLATLNFELKEIEGIDMDLFGFDLDDLFDVDNSDDDTYTDVINIPQYEIQGDKPNLDELINKDKVDDLTAEIRQSTLPENEKDFLITAAQRHNVFDYTAIAEYYAHATPEMQELMEKSALVLIDLNNAIANGYAKLKKDIGDLPCDEECDDDNEVLYCD